MLASLIAGLVGACAGSATPSAAAGTVPVTFVYLIDGLDPSIAHTTHIQILDGANTLVSAGILQAAGTVDTGTFMLAPGNDAAIVWDEEAASPDPIVSTKCGAPFTVQAGVALVVTITNSRIGACVTDLTQPGASDSPGPSGPSESPAAS